MSDKPLQGKVIALPESRQLDVLAAMLDKRGAVVNRCPLVAILDRPDQQPVLRWLQICIEQPFDLFIILTGEGLRRLLASAARAGRREAFIEAITKLQTLVRGPKPAQALKEIGLKADASAEQPTTDGVIASLEQRAIEGWRIGVQLYGDDPNTRLVDYLRQRGAEVLTVAPYIYAPDSDEQQVLLLIDALAAGRIDAITFTSQPQIKRLQAVADKHGRKQTLCKGLQSTIVAAVGPVVANALAAAGIRVDMMPEDSFFMKPMVTKLEELFRSRR